MATSSGASAEALPLPKGGGSTRGLGDGFSPDLNRGTGSYAIRIQVPDGYRTLTPQLGLTYNTAAGDGPFGFGWTLPLARIQIDTDRGVADYLEPQFILDGETLVEMGGGRFRPRVENAFHRIQRVAEGWEITDKSGALTRLGTTAAARVTGPMPGDERTFAWLADAMRDTSGNEVTYEYLKDGGQLYVSRVAYAAFEIRFIYEARHDVTVNRRAGFALTQRLRCRQIEVHRPDQAHSLLRRYTLAYLAEPDAPSLLSRVTMEGFKRQPDGSMLRTEAPPVDFTYASFAPQTRQHLAVAQNLPQSPGPLGIEGRELVDLHGDGLPDIVQLAGNRCRYWQNLGQGRFAFARSQQEFPQPMALAAPSRLLDADGRGSADLVVLGQSLARYYPNEGNGSFGRPRFFGGRQPLAFSFMDPDTALADIDGDGRVDLVKTTQRGLIAWRNRGGDEGFDPPTVTPASADRDAVPDVRLSEPGVFLADMTGDGLPDLVRVASGLVEYWPALGGGRYDTRQLMREPPLLPTGYERRRVFLADVDGDGTSDVIYVGPDRVMLWCNLGGVRFAPPIDIGGTPNSAIDSIRLTDLLGSGLLGVLWSSVQTSRGPGYRYLSFADEKPYLLTRIREGVGLEVEIEYDSSAMHAARDAEQQQPWSTRLPMVVHVVKRITRRDLATGVEDTSEQFYHDGTWDGALRRFRGFGRVTVRRLGDADTMEAYEEHCYLVGAPSEPAMPAPMNLTQSDVGRARRGQGYRSTYFSALPGSAPIRVEETQWALDVSGQAADGSAILFPHVRSTEVRNCEGGDHPRVVHTDYSYDAFGNVTREHRRGFAPTGDHLGNPVERIEVQTDVTYAQNPARHVMDRVARTVRRDAAGNVLAEIRHYYDGPALNGLPLGQVEAGLLVRQEEIAITRADAAALYGADEPDWAALGYHEVTRVDGVAALAINQTRYAHSARGLIARRVDPFGAETVFEYDSDGLLVVRMTNAVGHTRVAQYDPSWQLIEDHSTPDGSHARYIYDGLGRLVALIHPGDSEALPTLRYLHDHTSVPTSVRTERRALAGSPDAYVKVVYYDGFGRALQERTLVTPGKVRVSGVTQLNRRGDPLFRGQPQLRAQLDFEPPATLPPTPGSRYRYDAVGRLIEATNPVGKLLRTTYTPWTAEISDVIDTDPAHPHATTPRIQHFDAFGRLGSVTLVGLGAANHRADYRYDPLGRLIASRDLAGREALRRVVYDNRGARLQIDHVTAGVRTAIFDARGRLVKYQDARNTPVERSFDAIDRILSESVGGAVQERYHYDLTPAQLGRLGRVEDQAGEVTFSYDQRGRVVGKRRTINGDSYELGYEYDSSGLQRRIVYPDGQAVSFERWGDGRVRSAAGFVDQFDYSDNGRLAGVGHANGVSETFDYDVTGYITRVRAARGADVLYDAHLTHDAAGRLTRLEHDSDVGSRVETYAHDEFGHLMEFEREEGAATTHFSYRYDADGNLLRADEMSATQYTYDFSAVGALTGRDLADGSHETLAFDAAGHMTALAGMNMEFDARGRLSRVTRSDGTVVEMTYDYRGARVAKRVSSGAGTTRTRYVDEIYEDRAGVTTAYVFAAGRLVGHLRGGGRRHIHVDHRASVLAITRADGTIDGRGWFGPYGTAESLADPDGSRQYTGATFDSETGLHYLNLRFYSPALGRFLSPDPRFLAQPERELDVPEAHNLFAYANGDPVDYVDPSGEGFWSTFGKVLGAIVVAIAVIAAVVVTIALIWYAGPALLAGAALGAIIGGIADGWEGAALGAMMGATIGINLYIGGPIGIVNFLGIFPGIRQQDWYKSLAGWTSWFMPASWPGHIMGLGVFLGNGIAHIFGSDKQIESVKFDWSHGQILTAGGEYGGTPFPWLGMSGPSHNLGGFSFWSNDTWAEGGKSWKGIEDSVNSGRGFAHETGHMLSNALFGFWQGIVNGIENLTTEGHDDRFFEKIAQSNVEPSDRNPDDQIIPIWN